MKITTSFVALAVAAGALTMTTGSSAYAVEACFGLTPTIVGTAGDGTLSGTAGDDVIVDTFGHPIEAGDGNDTICSMGSRFISAGAGDDRVSLVEPGKGPFTFLGTGSDHYVGSDADERVNAGAFDSTELLEGNPGDVDTISTLGGKDRVHSLAYSYPNADVIDLGDGPDSVRLISLPGATFQVEGGDGSDGLEFDHHNVDADLSVDLGTGGVAIGAATAARVVGFESAYASSARHQVTLTGTTGPDHLSASAKDARVFGLGGNDTIHVDGCGAEARGDGGADELTVGYAGCTRHPVELRGGSGNDTLRGGQRRDVLLGNSGRDTARGGKGRDRCQAEVKLACER